MGALGWATPVATVILAHAFFGLDALGEELEQRFSLAQNAVPLDALVRAIETIALDNLEATVALTLLDARDSVLL